MGAIEVVEVRRHEPFNSPLETGLRSLALLEAAFPERLDLQRLVELDYLVVHSADIGGPDSLHAPLPLRAGELLVRRDLIERGLLLLISRGLIDRRATKDGIEYAASEQAASYLSSLSAPYTLRLRERARWLVLNFEGFTTDELRDLIRSFFARWSSEFEPLKLIG
jgi:hypothetical protein